MVSYLEYKQPAVEEFDIGKSLPACGSLASMLSEEKCKSRFLKAKWTCQTPVRLVSVHSTLPAFYNTVNQDLGSLV